MGEKKAGRTPVEIAKQLAAEIEQKNLEEPYKSILFSKLLDMALREDTLPAKQEKSGIQELSAANQKASGANNNPVPDHKKQAAALCTRLGLDERQFFSLIELRDEKFHVISKEIQQEKKDSEKQRRIALLYIYINESCYGKPETPIQTIKKELNDLGISDNNLSTALKSYENFIKMAGQKGSHNTAYFLTYPGRTEAEQLIKKLAEGLTNVK